MKIKPGMLTKQAEALLAKEAGPWSAVGRGLSWIGQRVGMVNATTAGRTARNLTSNITGSAPRAGGLSTVTGRRAGNVARTAPAAPGGAPAPLRQPSPTGPTPAGPAPATPAPSGPSAAPPPGPDPVMAATYNAQYNATPEFARDAFTGTVRHLGPYGIAAGGLGAGLLGGYMLRGDSRPMSPYRLY